MYVAASTPIARGPCPTGIGFPTTLLFVALITETSPSKKLATYIAFRLSSTPMAKGPCPTGMGPV